MEGFIFATLVALFFMLLLIVKHWWDEYSKSDQEKSPTLNNRNRVMTIKELNKLYLKWNSNRQEQRFGQYVLANSVLSHHLTEEMCNYLTHESNSVVVYNKILLICID